MKVTPEVKDLIASTKAKLNRECLRVEVDRKGIRIPIYHGVHRFVSKETERNIERRKAGRHVWT